MGIHVQLKKGEFVWIGENIRITAKRHTKFIVDAPTEIKITKESFGKVQEPTKGKIEIEK